jgi:uncharacterized caspase-like protein
MKLSACAGVALAVSFAAAASAAHVAVCVGVNEYDTDYVPRKDWLRGCVADAGNLWTNLTQRGEWTPGSATLLLDGAATKDAIRDAITNAAAAAAPGDVFVYTHSSHGWSEEDETGAYTADTGLCAYDGDYADYELAADLAKFPSGAKVVVFVDACHSAGLFKDKHRARARSAAASPAPAPFALAERVGAEIDAIRAKEPVRRGSRPKGISSSEIGWVTAADYFQYSFDSEDEVGGEFTLAANRGWRTGACDVAPCGDEDGYANFHELWNYAKDIAVGEGPPGTEDYTEAQCFNTDVLRSVRAGWVGDEPPSDVRFVPIPEQTATVGEPLDYTLVATNLAGVAGSISYSVESATAPSGTYSLDGADFTFTPASDGEFSFSFRATNATAGASAKATMAVSAVLAAPSGLASSGLTDSSFTASWDAVAGATSYLLAVSNNVFGVGGEPDFQFSQTVTGTSFTVDGLIPGTYYWRVCAVGNGPGPFSETVEVTLVADPSAPPSIRSIGDIAVPVGQTATATIRVGAPEEAPVTSLEITEGDSSAVLEDGLFSFTPEAVGTYSFTITAVNANGPAQASFSVVAFAPKKFALCVGINEYAHISSLAGCVNDAKFMAANLEERGGWDAADMTVLLDSQATKSAIRGAISNIAAKVVSGDTFVYQHSSHGGQFNDTTGDLITNETGKATFLCVYDEDYYDNTTAYNDYEIADDLAAFPTGVKVAVIVDACHSAGLFKSRDAARAAAASFDLAGRVSAHMEGVRARRRARGENVARSLSASEIGWAVAAEYYDSLDGGFYHTDAWMVDPCYGDEWWMEDGSGDGYYDLPDSYRRGGIFLCSSTWGWWSGDADADKEAGDNDGLCDVYEFWKKGYDFSSQVGMLWYGEPEYDFHPQCTNVTVLRSVELGWIAPPPGNPIPAFPPDSAPERIASSLAGSADSALVEHVADADAYSAYRAWAQAVKLTGGAALAGAAAVRESPHAWLSFALGSDTLLPDDFGSDDVRIVAFGPADNAGAFAFEVEIDGVEIGSSAAVTEKTLLENLMKAFLVEGAETPEPDEFSPAGVDVEVWVDSPAGDRVRLLAVPPDDASDAFFFRVRVE